MSQGRTPRNVAASLRERLLQLARKRGEDFQLVLTDFATERFLYRLGTSEYADRFVLKGAMLLRVWSDVRYRATWDVDLMGHRIASPDAIVSALLEVCAMPSDDGLTFDPETAVVEDIRDEEEYVGVRVKVVWSLAGAKIPMQIDVAIGDVVVPSPKVETYPTLLGHPPPRILAYPRETVVAEKLEAILSFGPTNTRMKDFYDLRLLASHSDFDGATLSAAIRATFERRGTRVPESEPPEFSDAYLAAPERRALWRSFWRRNRPSEPPESVEELGAMLRSFLGPVVNALATGSQFSSRWSAGGPWR